MYIFFSSNITCIYLFQIVEYSLSKQEYTQFSEQLLLNPPKELIDRSFPINCITFDASRNDSMIFSDDNTICVLTKDEISNDDSKKPKIKKLELSQAVNCSVKTIQNYEVSINVLTCTNYQVMCDMSTQVVNCM